MTPVLYVLIVINSKVMANVKAVDQHINTHMNGQKNDMPTIVDLVGIKSNEKINAQEKCL